MPTVSACAPPEASCCWRRSNTVRLQYEERGDQFARPHHLRHPESKKQSLPLFGAMPTKLSRRRSMSWLAVAPAIMPRLGHATTTLPDTGLRIVVGFAQGAG